MYIVLAALALLALWSVLSYNALVGSRNKVDEAWSGIEVQLKRRSDLIPNLVETVKGYAQHESGTFEAITKARAAATAATTPEDRAKAEGQVSSLIGRIVAISEAYPELKANQNFLELQNQLAETEDQIQMSRRYYNGAVRNLNISIQSFPDVVVARSLGFQEEPFFELESRAEAAAPQIGFPGGGKA